MSNTRRRILGFAALLGLPAAARAQTPQTAPAAPPLLACDRVQQDAGHKITYKQDFTLDKGRLTRTGINKSIVTDRPVRATFEPGYGTVPETTPPSPTFVATSGISLTAEMPFGTSKVSFLARLKVPAPLGVVTATYVVGKDAPKPVENLIEPKQAPMFGYEDVGFYWLRPPADIAAKVVTVNLFNNAKPIGSFTFDMSRRKWKDFLARVENDLTARRDVVITSNGLANVDGCYLPEVMPCFFTTAAVTTMGLSDDCWELQSLRAFRDGPLQRRADGDALVRQYYRDAPAIVAAIDGRSDARHVWTEAYWRYILPCAVLSALRLDGLALDHYRRLVAWLGRAG